MAAKVLVVHPELAYREFTERTLGERGHRVYAADGPRPAIQRFCDERPDAVLLSMRIAQRDGFDLVRQLAWLRGERFVPIIVLVDDDLDQLPRCIAAGADDFVRNTNDRTVLQCRLDGLLRVQSAFREVDAQKVRVERREAKLVDEQRIAEKLFSRIQSRNVDIPEAIRRMVSPHSVFNGDILLTAQTPAGATRVLLGDFTGHGLVAALGGMPLFDAFHSMTDKGFSIPMMMEELNGKLRGVLPTGLFCAAIVFEIDPMERLMRSWNGGMHSLLVRGHEGGIRLRLPSRHLALGILPNSQFDGSVEIHRIEPGERVLAYSDGVVEAGDGEAMFGQARLEQLFGGPASHDDFLDDLDRRLREFLGQDGQADDITVIDFLYDGVVRETKDRGLGNAISAPSRWSTSCTLEASALRHRDPVPTILQPIFNLQGLDSHRQSLHMIVAELFNNALDHGLLGLDSSGKTTPEGFQRYYAARTEGLAQLSEGKITITMSHEPRPDGGDLTIEVADTGAGFDVDAARDAQTKPNLLSGRGMRLVRELCTDLVYEDGGRRARATYAWRLGD